MLESILPKETESLWLGTTGKTHYGVLKGNLETDVAIIGGGIAGINAAYFLKKRGLKTVLIETFNLATGTSGNTTAKITSLHELKYAYLAKTFGLKKAGIYADSNQWAITKLEEIIKNEGIDCDFEMMPAITYTRTKEGIERIKKEVEAAIKLRLPAIFVKSLEDIPFKIKGAVMFKNQAYFHPRKFLLSIAKIIKSDKCLVFEKTKALDIRENSRFCEVITNRGAIKAKNVIIATNFPFYDKNKIFRQMPLVRSYALACRLKQKMPEGMFIGIESEDLSFRPHKSGGKEWLIIGGVHQFVDEKSTINQYRKLEQEAREVFAIRAIDYKWAAQDSMPVDRVPYIGFLPSSKRILVTTGYGAWGMTTSFVSAKLLTDLITGEKNAWKDFYDPVRVKSSLKTMNQGDKEMAGIKNNEGKVISSQGEKLAVYKDDHGQLHAVSAVCTHMGCIVGWNNKDKTWDCPCHGSRYNKDGKVIHGPAPKDLPQKEIPKVSKS